MSVTCIIPRQDPQFCLRFWAKVDRSSGDDSCWPWTGGRDGKGYGAFKYNSVMLQAPRVALILHSGPPPVIDGYHGACALHSCDNRTCCNPGHLRFGTALENSRDARSRNRLADRKGSRNGMARLSESAVRGILASHLSQSVLAKVHGVAQTTIGRVKRLESWKHVSGT